MEVFISKAGNVFYKDKPLTEGEELLVKLGLLAEVSPQTSEAMVRAGGIELKGDHDESLCENNDQ